MKSKLCMSVSNEFDFPRMLECCCGQLIKTGRTPRIPMTSQLKSHLIRLKMRYNGALTLYLTSPKFIVRYK